MDATGCSFGTLHRVTACDAGRCQVTLLLMWTLANESGHTWDQVLRTLRDIYGDSVHDSSITILSDGDKGLMSKIKEHLPKTNHVLCYKHLEANVLKQGRNMYLTLKNWPSVVVMCSGIHYGGLHQQS